MEHLPAIITAFVALLGAAGAAIKWLWDKIEARFVKIETALEECEKRELASNERRGKHLTVIELLWAEVVRLSKGGQNNVLNRAKHLLDELKDTAA